MTPRRPPVAVAVAVVVVVVAVVEAVVGTACGPRASGADRVYPLRAVVDGKDELFEFAVLKVNADGSDYAVRKHLFVLGNMPEGSAIVTVALEIPNVPPGDYELAPFSSPSLVVLNTDGSFYQAQSGTLHVDEADAVVNGFVHFSAHDIDLADRCGLGFPLTEVEMGGRVRVYEHPEGEALFDAASFMTFKLSEPGHDAFRFQGTFGVQKETISPDTKLFGCPLFAAAAAGEDLLRAQGNDECTFRWFPFIGFDVDALGPGSYEIASQAINVAPQFFLFDIVEGSTTIRARYAAIAGTIDLDNQPSAELGSVVNGSGSDIEMAPLDGCGQFVPDAPTLQIDDMRFSIVNLPSQFTGD